MAAPEAQVEPQAPAEDSDAVVQLCEEHTPRSCDPSNNARILSKYVHRAEQTCFGKSLSGYPLFSQGDTSSAPVLCKDRPNRIIVFVGCFNPPHLGHLELLAHIFLRTDGSTIAAMLVPCGAGNVHDKRVKGEKFKLTKYDQLMKEERASLLQDELLSRFSWVFRGRKSDLGDFREKMISAAGQDGYQLSFTSLSGSDHYAENLSRMCYGTGDHITSDISRDSELVTQSGAQPRKLDGCGAWRKILPVKSVLRKGHKNCWPCRKIQTMCPECKSLSS